MLVHHCLKGKEETEDPEHRSRNKNAERKTNHGWARMSLEQPSSNQEINRRLLLRAAARWIAQIQKN